MIGLWIDSLTDAERDRIIEHPDQTYEGGEWWNKSRNCGCLVGCVVGIEYEGVPGWGYRGIATFSDEDNRWSEVGYRFPDFTARFGAPRMWRIVKARASRGNKVTIHVELEEAAHV